MNKITLTLIVSIATLVCGCGAEIAYKQGASARDLHANKSACEQAANEAAFNECLENNGWTVQKLGEKWLSDDDLFATASVTDNKQLTTRPIKSNVLKATDSINSEETTKIMPVKTITSEPIEPKSIALKPDIKSTEQAELVLNPAKAIVKPTETIALQPTIKKEVKPTATDTSTKLPNNILDIYEIKSWWKMGGNAMQLEKNMDECSATLGEAHSPNKVTFTFTRGFAICMREKGWRGLISQNK
ncbi:MAG: hypothetical protein P8O76_02060 [Methylophilaceae bacterium]|nr:hypothetical protein [Methylophilaceae bacterium]